MNATLAAQGSPIRAAYVEYYAAGDRVGNTVFFAAVGNKQLFAQFVPGDPRRAAWSGPPGPGDDITWASDLVEGDAGPGLVPTQTAIGNAMATWNSRSCSTLPLTVVAPGGDLGVLQFLVTAGASGSPFPPAADVTQAGFGTPVGALLPPPIIAAAFTFFFPTDIDNDQRPDAAFREIYYTMNFPWGMNTGFPIDVETVALHETGHGLSQAHFGKLFRTDANGKFHFAPRAVMNAGYTGVQQTLAGTDDAGHCSMWGMWPSR